MIRFFTVFAAPVTMDLEWSDSGIEGASRFLSKLWSTAQTTQPSKNTLSAKRQSALNVLFQKITDDYDRHNLNTIASGCMKLFKIIQDARQDAEEEYILWLYLLMSLYPIAPHIAVVIWDKLFPETQLTQQPWPSLLEIEEDQYQDIALQVNGKMKGMITIPNQTTQDTIHSAIMASEKSSVLKDLQIKKIIFIPGKIINVVAS